MFSLFKPPSGNSKLHSFNDLSFTHNRFSGYEYVNHQVYQVEYIRAQEDPNKQINVSLEEKLKLSDNMDATIKTE